MVLVRSRMVSGLDQARAARHFFLCTAPGPLLWVFRSVLAWASAWHVILHTWLPRAPGEPTGQAGRSQVPFHDPLEVQYHVLCPLSGEAVCGVLRNMPATHKPADPSRAVARPAHGAVGASSCRLGLLASLPDLSAGRLTWEDLLQEKLSCQ